MNTKSTAQGLASLGRNGDTMLVHMTPNEVNGLQALAKANGTTLTTNPKTGLPEAFNLDDFFATIAPTALGFGANFLLPGSGGLAAGILAGSAVGALTNKENPLMGALGGAASGFGGASLANSAASFGANAGANAAQSTASNAINQAGGIADAASVADLTKTNSFGGANFLAPGAEQSAFSSLMPAAPSIGDANSLLTPMTSGQPGVAGLGGVATSPSAPGFSEGLSNAVGNIAANPIGFVKENPFGVGAPLAMATLAGLAPEPMQMGENPDEKYDPNRRLNLNYDTGLRLLAGGGSVFTSADGPDPRMVQQPTYGIGRLDSMATQQSDNNAQMGMYAEGGALESGGFVVPADVVSHLGNGSSDAGLKTLMNTYGARPLKGDGDGMSDDIPTTIDGAEPARVAHEEAYIPREVVEQYGGPQAFYSMMNNIRKARTGSTKQGRQIDPEDYLV